MSRKKRPRAAAVAREKRTREKGSSAQAKWFSVSKVVVIAAALCVAVGGLVYLLFSRQNPSLGIAPSLPMSSPIAGYAGTKACAGCHAEAYEAWKGSDHALAMQHANVQSVLGN